MQQKRLHSLDSERAASPPGTLALDDQRERDAARRGWTQCIGIASATVWSGEGEFPHRRLRYARIPAAPRATSYVLADGVSEVPDHVAEPRSTDPKVTGSNPVGRARSRPVAWCRTRSDGTVGLVSGRWIGRGGCLEGRRSPLRA